MIYGALSLVLAAFVLAADPPRETDLAKGVRQVEEGDYNGAIVTLDSAASALRLSKDASAAKDLGQAYLYLGIAYVGLGHETSAKAKFREALLQSKGMNLSPQQFPPKVIELFEVAKREGQPPAAAVAPAPAKKGGSKKGLIIGGTVLAGGGVAAAVLLGGGEDGQVFNATGTTEQFNCSQEFRFVPAAQGTLEATVSWTPAEAVAELHIELYDEQFMEVGRSNPVSNLEARLSAPVTNQIYKLYVCQGGFPNAINFTLTVRYP